MEINTKKIGQDVLKWTVVGGSAVIAVNSIMQLTKSTSLKSAIMPAITLLVGVSAFSYAMTAEKVGFVPKLDESKSEEKSNAVGIDKKGLMPTGTTMPTIPSGRLKKGDQKIFNQGTKDAECCTWTGSSWRCVPAPCSISV
jgi:hypothetical protein